MSTKSYRQTPEGWAKIQYYRSKQRAKELGINFDLTEEWLLKKLPKVCPVYGTDLIIGADRPLMESSPSVDRVDNSLGYTQDNCEIISYKANTLKRTASIEDLQRLIDYMSRHQLANVTIAAVDTHLL